MNAKKFSTIVPMIFLLSVMLICFSACTKTDDEVPGVPAAKITFDSCGGSDVAIAEAEKNDAISMPETPEWKSYDFAGWYTDKEYTTEFANSELAADATVYAKWTNDGKTVCTELLDLHELADDMSDAEQGLAWNKASRTLTLSGFTLDTTQIDTNDSSVGIVFPRCPNQPVGAKTHTHTSDCPSNTLILTDGTVNTVDTGRAINEYYSTAIYSGSSLIIKTSGSGTPGILNSTAAPSKELSLAIYVSGDITIESGNVTAVAGSSTSNNSIGINVYRGNIYIKNGTVTAIGGESSANPSEENVYGSFGLSGEKIQIDTATVTATGGLSKTALSAGILSKQSLALGGGNITATGDTAAAASFAELTIADGTMVNAKTANISEIKDVDQKGHSLHTFVDEQNAILKDITIAP